MICVIFDHLEVTENLLLIALKENLPQELYLKPPIDIESIFDNFYNEKLNIYRKNNKLNKVWPGPGFISTNICCF